MLSRSESSSILDGARMTLRRYRESDRAALEHLAAHQDFPYPDSESTLVESFWVAVDETDTPCFALAAYRSVQLYLYASRDTPPIATLQTSRELLRNVSDDLRYSGFTEAEGFVSPHISRRFGRHIQKHFKAIRNWASWSFKL